MPILRLALAALILFSLAACGEDEEEGSATMNPGSSCLACHGFTAAGTVFGGGDAPASAGISGATVKLTDSRVPPQVVTLVTNAAGNFFTSAALTMPLDVEITYEGNVATMSNATGACASCHAPDTTTQPARVHVGTCPDCH